MSNDKNVGGAVKLELVVDGERVAGGTCAGRDAARAVVLAVLAAGMLIAVVWQVLYGLAILTLWILDLWWALLLAAGLALIAAWLLAGRARG